MGHPARARKTTHLPSGASILPGAFGTAGGLPIAESAALPFLLAARAQSVAVDEKSARPLFAYGIAASYEAFARLSAKPTEGSRDSDRSDDDREGSDVPAVDSRRISDSVAWYRREIDRALEKPDARDAHPKIRATIDKAVELWLSGEKCLIFCWFIKTGEAVERALAKRVDDLILARATAAFGTRTMDETRAELDRISDRLFRRDGSSYGRIRTLLHDAVAGSKGRGASLHPVRRVHGGTERDIRERLIASFNTPLSPDLLVASSVMGEGIICTTSADSLFITT